jgi:hypothetical protein
LLGAKRQQFCQSCGSRDDIRVFRSWRRAIRDTRILAQPVLGQRPQRQRIAAERRLG